MSRPTVAVVDLDAFKYSVAFAGEKRKVEVVHKSTGKTYEVKNRTEWYGRGKAKDKGWLGEINSTRDSPFTWDEFDYIDIQVPEPIANILHSAKRNVETVVKASQASKAHYFIGKGESFRVKESTLLKYKESRSESIKPLMLDEVVEYMTKKFKAEVVEYLEVDDKITIECWQKPDKFVIVEDKDAYGSGVNVFNFNKPNEGVIHTNCYGKLWRTDKGDVRGVGRMFKLWQATFGDPVDHYKANCFSDVSWGEVSAYEALVGSKNDKELFQNAINSFKLMYPEPKIVTGWRGDEIEIDAVYVFNEMLNMCHMHRWENDFLDAREIMDKLGVNYSYD